MGILSRDEDTICAICTPPGVGGIAVLRISGSQALEVARKVCPFIPTAAETHRVFYGFAKTVDQNNEIDEVLATYFAANRSFTGESTVEISCHGGFVVSEQLLEEVRRAGARLAERGEFTYRAFMNQRLDLVQAESVLNLIEANSRRASELALRHLKGDLSAYVNRLEDAIHWILAHLEANIDFAYEDIEAASTAELVSRLRSEVASVDRVLESYRQGRMLRDGIRIAIVGPPNAGKSSLMNALVGEERSIVTEIAGTTRDTIEGALLVNGVKVTFVDTAGLRETQDRVEQLGISRTRAAIKDADLVWWVVDLGDLESSPVDAAVFEVGSEQLWVLGNKTDLVLDGSAEARLGNWLEGVSEHGMRGSRRFCLSCLNPQSVAWLRSELEEQVKLEFSEVSAVLTNSRHRELFEVIKRSLDSGLELVERGESAEFVAFELRAALMGVHELLGRKFDDEVLDRVFKEFCLGK